jgi:hypothetical protein
MRTEGSVFTLDFSHPLSNVARCTRFSTVEATADRRRHDVWLVTERSIVRALKLVFGHVAVLSATRSTRSTRSRRSKARGSRANGPRRTERSPRSRQVRPSRSAHAVGRFLASEDRAGFFRDVASTSIDVDHPVF